MSGLSIDELFSGESGEWLDAVPEYQREILRSLMDQHDENPEVAAIEWLSGLGPSHTVAFGTSVHKSAFFDRMKLELRAFLCGDEKYEDDRQRLIRESNVTKAYVVGTLSVLLAPVLGSSAPFLAPALVLLGISISKMGLNAWCAATGSDTAAASENPENSP